MAQNQNTKTVAAVIVAAVIAVGCVAAAGWLVWKYKHASNDLLANLDAEHTVAAGELRELDALAATALDALKSVPPGVLDKELSADAVVAKLGFNPAERAAWAASGLDPEAGIAVVLDDRLVPGGSDDRTPVPYVVVRVTDPEKLNALLKKFGAQVALNSNPGVQEVKILEASLFVGVRGKDTVVAPVPDSENRKASLKVAFESLLKTDGLRLGEDSQFKTATEGRKNATFVTYVASKNLTQWLQGTEKTDAQFFAQLFPAAALWLGLENGARLVTSTEAQSALAQIVKPEKTAPSCARLLPKEGWGASRLSINLKDAPTGIVRLLAPSMDASARDQVKGATDQFTKTTSVNWTEITASFSGHFCMGYDVAGVIGAAMSGRAPAVWLGMVGVQDGTQADLLLAKTSGLLKSVGAVTVADADVGGRKGYAVTLGEISVAIVRDGDRILVAPAVAQLQAALAREKADSMAGSSLADALDGDVVWGFAVDLKPAIDAAKLGLATVGDKSIQAASPAINGVLDKLLAQRFIGAALVLDKASLSFGTRGEAQLQSTIALLPVLAVVAVPQFTKYMRTAKTAEAIELLDLLKKGAATYYTTPRTDASGVVVPCQFPETIGITPSVTTCCSDGGADADGDDRCDANPAAWDARTWSALKFAITDQHYFRYEFRSSGTLADATATIRAYGDLDCDGNFSTFELSLKGDPNATLQGCEMVSTGAMFSDNETE